jgi:thioredoxin 2
MIVRCRRCGTRNRVAAVERGYPQCAKCHLPLPWLVEAEQATFDHELRSSLPVLVDFWAPWCAPCRVVAPAVENLAARHAGRLKVVKLNLETAPAVAARFRVEGIPLLLLFGDGRELERVLGAVPESELEARVAPHLAPPAAAAQ